MAVVVVVVVSDAHRVSLSARIFAACRCEVLWSFSNDPKSRGLVNSQETGKEQLLILDGHLQKCLVFFSCAR